MAIAWNPTTKSYYRIPEPSPTTAPSPKTSGDSTSSREPGSKVDGKEYVSQDVVKYYLLPNNKITYRVGGAAPPGGAEEISEQSFNVLRSASSGERVSASVGGKNVNVEKRGDVYLVKGKTDEGKPTQETIMPGAVYHEAFFKDMPKAPASSQANTFLASEGFISLYKEREPQMQEIREREKWTTPLGYTKEGTARTGMVGIYMPLDEYNKLPQPTEVTLSFGEREMLASTGFAALVKTRQGDIQRIQQREAQASAFAAPTWFERRNFPKGTPEYYAQQWQMNIKSKGAQRISEGKPLVFGKTISQLKYYEPEMEGHFFNPITVARKGTEVVQQAYYNPASTGLEYAAYGGAFKATEIGLPIIAKKVPYISKLAPKITPKRIAVGTIATIGAVQTTSKMIGGQSFSTAISETSAEVAVPILAIYGATKSVGLGRDIIGGVKTRIARAKQFKISNVAIEGQMQQPNIVPIVEYKTTTTSFFKRLPKPAESFAVKLQGGRVADVTAAKRSVQDVAGYGKITRGKEGLRLQMAGIETTTPEFVPRINELAEPQFAKVSYPSKQKISVKPYERLKINPATLYQEEGFGITESGIKIPGLKTKPRLSTLEYANQEVSMGRLEINTYYRSQWYWEFGKKDTSVGTFSAGKIGKDKAIINIKTGYKTKYGQTYSVSGYQSPYTALRHELYHYSRPDIDFANDMVGGSYTKKGRLWEQEIELMAQSRQRGLGRTIMKTIHPVLSKVLYVKHFDKLYGKMWDKGIFERKYPAPNVKAYPWVTAKDIPVKGYERTQKRLFTTVDTPKPKRPKGPIQMVEVLGAEPISRSMIPKPIKQELYPRPERVQRVPTLRKMMQTKKAQMGKTETIQFEKPKFEKPSDIWSAEKFYRKGKISPILNVDFNREGLFGSGRTTIKSSIIETKAMRDAGNPFKPTTRQPIIDATKVRQPSRIVPAIFPIPKQDIKPRLDLGYKYDTFTPSPEPVPIPITPTGGGFFIPPFSLADYGGKRGGGLMFSRKTKYAPDLASIAMNIRKKGKVPKGGTIFSPAGLRPIIIGR